MAESKWGFGNRCSPAGNYRPPTCGLIGKLFSHISYTFGEKKAVFFSVAVMNEVVDEPPTNQDAVEFLKENWVLVEREAEHLVDDPELAKVMSYLYAADSG